MEYAGYGAQLASTGTITCAHSSSNKAGKGGVGSGWSSMKNVQTSPLYAYNSSHRTAAPRPRMLQLKQQRMQGVFTLMRLQCCTPQQRKQQRNKYRTGPARY